ncbi:zinc-dependent metalloprotease [Halobacteriovorax sp. GB3]|uniref:zinc-dependent metalloprotease n=1 Tax=Halobacteriovorax sp. GB3 TaxID=2719615 RepID=UPI0023630844|nr:zinc-dependent metalloprotease [Halobacteriovorax sp. GB3]MDD0852712.1 zinc-dependent metalloprotease [Halobacteriovorax sp. GB3]
MSKKKLLNLGLIATALLVASCAEERKEEFAQGQGEELLSISDYNGKTFDLKTKEVISGDSENFSATREVKVDGLDAVNNLLPVDYVTNAPLFQGFAFRGLPNHDYKLQYEVKDKYLVINKIAKKEAIPFDELTYAVEMENGLYKVPLIGYPIQLTKVEKIKNSYGEETHQLRENGEKMVIGSTHFKINHLGQVQYFGAKEKKDIFPSHFFDGEWFYAATIVSASTKNATSIGRDLSIDAEANGVSRIRFNRYKDTIKAINLNQDKIIDTTDDINNKTAFNIPVSWVDYKKNTRNGVDLFEEVLLDDSNNEAPEWAERRFAKIDFSKFVYKMVKGWEFDATVNSWVPKVEDLTDGILQKLEVTNDFISWTLWYEEEEIRIKYALRRAHKPIAGRVYKKSDVTKFGFFQTTKHMILNHRIERDKDLEKLKFLNRFDPNKKEIRYFFSTNTSQDMRAVGREGIRVWNETFKKAGSDIEIVLDESKDVEIGDIRYNILNIVDTKDGSGLLGYGPSISDTESGEIISATNNIYANPFRESQISNIRNYMRRELGLHAPAIEGLKITSKLSNRLTSNIAGAAGSSAFGAIDNSIKNTTAYKLHQSYLSTLAKSEDAEKESVKSYINTLDKVIGTGDLHKLEETDHAHDHNHDIVNMSYINNPSSTSMGDFINHGSKCAFNVVDNNSYERIQKECPEVDAYVADVKANGGTLESSERELELVRNCAEKLIFDDVLATFVHELGHNLGLRHNFAASNDAKNYTYKDGKPVALTASTMDYLTRNVEELPAPGAYDVAAIKFGYVEKVETEDGREIALNGKSIEQAMKDAGVSRKEYNYCTDEHVDLTSPLCKRWDHGSNPEEIVEYLIEDFKSFVALYGHKYDRIFSPDMYRLASKFYRTTSELKGLHDHWRKIVAQALGKKKQYLQGINANQMKQVIAVLDNDNTELGRQHRLYYPAVEKSFNFLLELANQAQRVCYVKPVGNSVESVQALDFETIKEQVWGLTGQNIYDCSDAVGLLGNAEIVGADGYFMNDVRLDNNAGNPDDYFRNSTAGMSFVKRLAAISLSDRAPRLIAHYNEGFYPNYLDNPLWRSQVLASVQDRIVNGVSVANLTESKMLKSANVSHVPLFSTQKENMIVSLLSYQNGQRVPGDLEETRQRTGAYSVYSVDDPSLIPQGYVSAAISNYYFFANPSAPSGQLITLRNELVEMKTLAKISGVKQFLPQISNFLTQAGYYNLTEKDLVGTTQEVQQVEAQAEEVVQGEEVSSEEIVEALEVKNEVVSNALTVEQYLEKINKNEAILQQIIQIVYQNTQMNITPLVQKAAGLQSNIKTVLEKAVNEGNGAMKVSEFLTLLAPAEQIAGLKQALFQDLTQAMDQALNATRAYSSNPDEKDAQIDALSKVIMSL